MLRAPNRLSFVEPSSDGIPSRAHRPAVGRLVQHRKGGRRPFQRPSQRRLEPIDLAMAQAERTSPLKRAVNMNQLPTQPCNGWSGSPGGESRVNAAEKTRWRNIYSSYRVQLKVRLTFYPGGIMESSRWCNHRAQSASLLSRPGVAAETLPAPLQGARVAAWGSGGCTTGYSPAPHPGRTTQSRCPNKVPLLIIPRHTSTHTQSWRSFILMLWLCPVIRVRGQ
jgi:hypothetical protein